MTSFTEDAQREVLQFLMTHPDCFHLPNSSPIFTELNEFRRNALDGSITADKKLQACWTEATASFWKGYLASNRPMAKVVLSELELCANTKSCYEPSTTACMICGRRFCSGCLDGVVDNVWVCTLCCE